MSSHLVRKLEEMGQNLETFIHDNSEAAKDLSDRLESLESLNDRPGMITAGNDGHEMKSAIDRFYRTGKKKP